MRGSIVIYDSWGRMISALPDEQALELVRMIFDYSFADAEPISEDISVNAIFGMIREKLDEDADAWEKTRQARSEAGKLGNEIRWGNRDASQSDNENRKTSHCDNRDRKASQSIANVAVSVSDSVSVYVSKDKEKDKKENRRFTPPSLKEVSEYITEKGYHVDAQSFVDFYTSKGWRVGNSPMKDWKACVRTWARRDKDKPASFNTHAKTEYDYAELERMLIKN